MADIYTKKDANREGFETESPLDQVMASDPKKFPYESKVHGPWGWYPFIYMSPAQLKIGGLDGMNFAVDGLPNVSFMFPSIEIGGGMSPHPHGVVSGDDTQAIIDSTCTPAVLAGMGGEGPAVEICKNLLGPCEMISLMNGTAASELGDWDGLSDAVNGRLGGDGSDPFTSMFNMTINGCGGSDKHFKFRADMRIQEIDAGIFCSPRCQCISFSYGAGFFMCTNRVNQDGSISEICSMMCNCGNSGHGCNSPSGKADWSGMFKAFANCVKSVANCAKDIVEANAECPNCNINTDALDALDTAF